MAGGLKAQFQQVAQSPHDATRSRPEIIQSLNDFFWGMDNGVIIGLQGEGAIPENIKIPTKEEAAEILKEVQRDLKTLGYYGGPIDGEIGSMAPAVKAFIEDHPLQDPNPSAENIKRLEEEIARLKQENELLENGNEGLKQEIEGLKRENDRLSLENSRASQELSQADKPQVIENQQSGYSPPTFG